MYLPTITKAITSSLALSSIKLSSRTISPIANNLTDTLLLGPSQNCISDPIKYIDECSEWSKAIVDNNLTKEVDTLRDSGVFAFLPGGPQFNNQTRDIDLSERSIYDSLYDPHYGDHWTPDEVVCQCCDTAKASSCCGFRDLSEENEKCCRREGPRCAYPLEKGGPHNIFCMCWGHMDCVRRGMWPAWVNPACRCDVTCNTG